MATFMLMTKLSPDITAKMKDRAKIGRAWLDKVKEKCPEVKFLAHYGLLGPFDFVDIYEAPNAETAAKVSMISLANGALQAESWMAIPYKTIVDLAAEIE
ncbi:MAG: GYD domain-containing protein [Candidatus Zixiibacteriota bacterium]